MSESDVAGTKPSLRGTAVRQELQLPTLDRSHIPSYWLAQRAHWMFLWGFVAMALFALAGALFVRMDLAIAAPGALEPYAVWPVRPLENGIVVAVTVQTGDTVERGEPIALLDPLEASAQVQNLDLLLRERKAEYQQAVLGLELGVRESREQQAVREHSLLRSTAALRQRILDVSPSTNVDSILQQYVPGTHIQIDLAYADVLDAESQVRLGRLAMDRLRLDSLDLVRRRIEIRRIENDLKTLRTRVARLMVPAPEAGVVLTDQVDRLLGASVQAGEQIAEIGDLTRWQAVLYVSERDAHDVHPGQSVTLQVFAMKALDGRHVNGHVLAVAPQAARVLPSANVEAVPAAGTFRVTVALDSTEVAALGSDALRRGYAVNGRIVTRSGLIADLALASIRQWFAERRAR